MDLRQLAVVVAVAEEGGFTAAALRLHTVQSTVSTVVRALERDLGTPLFHRTTHRVALTPAGEAFVPAARAALEAVERARAAISPVHGRVRIGLVPGLLTDLHRVLATLREAHPGLVVEVRRLAPDRLVQALAESSVDIAVGVLGTRTGSGGRDSRRETGSGAARENATDAPNPGEGSQPTGHWGATATPAPGDGSSPAGHHGTTAATLALGEDNQPTEGGPHAAESRGAAGLASTLPGPGGGTGGTGRAEPPPTGTPRPPGGSSSGGGGFVSHLLVSGSGAGLVTTSLPCEELVLATAPGGSRSAPGDLSGLSLVDFPAGWAIREVVDRAFADRRVSLEVDDLTTAAGLVRAGLAACVLPASAAARFPELTVRRFAAPPLWQLTATHREDPPAAVAAVLAQLG